MPARASLDGGAAYPLCGTLEPSGPRTDSERLQHAAVVQLVRGQRLWLVSRPTAGREATWYAQVTLAALGKGATSLGAKGRWHPEAEAVPRLTVVGT